MFVTSRRSINLISAIGEEPDIAAEHRAWFPFWDHFPFVWTGGGSTQMLRPVDCQGGY